MYDYTVLPKKSIKKENTEKLEYQKVEISRKPQDSIRKHDFVLPNVIQRTIKVANHDLKDAAKIFDNCRNLMEYGIRNYSIDISKEAYISYIQQMIDETKEYREMSYDAMRGIICQYVFQKQPSGMKTETSRTAIDGTVGGQPFTADELKAVSGDVQGMGASPLTEIFRTSSPLTTGNTFYRELRSPATVDFMIGSNETKYHVGGAGRFLAGVGSYSELAKTDVVGTEVKRLITGEIAISGLKAANEMYALIVAVEGCARSTHNIATATIFFENIEVLRAINIDRSLFQLMEMYLTFVPQGGAANSKNYVVNTNELNMILAHCKHNGVELTKEAIGSYLRSIAEGVLTQSNLRRAASGSDAEPMKEDAITEGLITEGIITERIITEGTITEEETIMEEESTSGIFGFTSMQIEPVPEYFGTQENFVYPFRGMEIREEKETLIYPFMCNETLESMIKEIKTTDALMHKTDEEVANLIFHYLPREYENCELSLYDWNTIAGITFINILFDKQIR